MTATDVQWYQSGTHVTITVLKPKDNEQGEAEVRCRKRKCELLIDGVVHWSCVLAHEVVASSCKCSSFRKRYEIKMRKEELIKWDNFEDVTAVDEDSMSSTLSSGSCDSATAIFRPISGSVSSTGQISNLPSNLEQESEFLDVKESECSNDKMTVINSGSPRSSMEERSSFEEPGFNSSANRDGHTSLHGNVFHHSNTDHHGNSTEIGGTTLPPDSLNHVRRIEVPAANKVGTESTTVEETNKVSPDSTHKLDDRDFLTDPEVADGLTGLVNLGNTCFMNSVVQCMSHTTRLRNYFLSYQYKADVNRENPLGCEGQLAYSFAGLVRKMWSNEEDYLYPRNLRNLVRNKFTQFQTMHQQDAQEFLGFFLDRLHEDLNKVKKKPLTEPVESKGKKDMEVAEESWDKHKQRNDSTVEDLFLGQFKSTLVCPTCQETSVVFDPYMSISVPIPSKMLHRVVIFVPLDPHKKPTKYLLRLPEEARLELLKASVARRTQLSMRSLHVFEAHRGKFQTYMKQNELPVIGIKATDTIIVSEVLTSTVLDTVVTIPVLQRIVIPSEPSKCESCSSKASTLKKCTGCKQVAYCNLACQSNDWKFHKDHCSQYKRGVKRRGPEPIGCPFIISLPSKQCTYENIVKKCEQFARQSVHIRQIGEMGQSSAEQSSSEIDDSEPEVEEEFKPFSLSTVTQHGETVKLNISPEDCNRENILGFYLAMDWNNDSSKTPYMEVVSKEMDCEEDSSLQQYAHVDESKPVTLEECLELFTEPETLTKDDAWYCPSCKSHKEATKQMSIWRLPQILVIHLKRFNYQNFIIRGKIDKFVKFPLKDLNMLPYILGDAQTTASSSHPLYELYGVVNHQGISNYGHYTAHIKPMYTQDKGTWYCFDDDHITECKHKQHVITKDAYVLFYKR
jgi:ubiquitin C-terminal hydrolase